MTGLDSAPIDPVSPSDLTPFADDSQVVCCSEASYGPRSALERHSPTSRKDGASDSPRLPRVVLCYFCGENHIYFNDNFQPHINFKIWYFLCFDAKVVTGSTCSMAKLLDVLKSNTVSLCLTSLGGIHRSQGSSTRGTQHQVRELSLKEGVAFLQ